MHDVGRARPSGIWDSALGPDADGALGRVVGLPAKGWAVATTPATSEPANGGRTPAVIGGELQSTSNPDALAGAADEG